MNNLPLVGLFDVEYYRDLEMWIRGHSRTPYNSNTPEPNFTKRACEHSLDIVVILVILVFPEFRFFSAQQPSQDGEV